MNPLTSDTDLVSLVNRRGCKEVFELVHRCLVVAALFIGNGILFTFPEGGWKRAVFGQVIEGMDVLESLTPRDPLKNTPDFEGDRIIRITIEAR